jgi:hypothetical protein
MKMFLCKGLLCQPSWAMLSHVTAKTDFPVLIEGMRTFDSVENRGYILVGTP